MSVLYKCDGTGCTKTSPSGGRGARIPLRWRRARGFIAAEDRAAWQGPRPVLHFCPDCIKHRDQSRITLGRQRLRMP